MIGVHKCYGPSTCRQPEAALCFPGFDYIVNSVAARIAARPGRPLPGQELQLLEQRTFARCTWATTGGNHASNYELTISDRGGFHLDDAGLSAGGLRG